MVFAVATNNQKKLKEIQRILDSFGITAKTLRELGVDVEIEENGTTFEENAVIKAKTIAQITNLPAISDDSGLEVDALNGAPGVYTARFAGENATDDENIDKLLASLEGLEKQDRTARFVSAVCLYMPDGRHTVCRGTCEGWIGFERIGDGGFGYDPVFMVEETSYSQMTAQAKDAISHRGSALRQLKEQIEQFI
ncbi:MAG: XTP/dITP diphosphatase [Ruminococcaceae bacterium]|nr:XTP/dITP diphosphatase [Oscillospiraceae bacterium]